MARSVPAASLQPRVQVTISPVEPEDMLECAKGQLVAFGTRMYGELEPLEIRAPAPIRYARFARRHLPLISRPDAMVMKATVPDPEGGKPKIAGLAWWHCPGTPVGNMQKRAVESMAEETEEAQESWRDFDWAKWNTMLEGYDAKRKEIMGDEPHWYLGPLWTHPNYQGQGVASALLRSAIALADATDPPTPMYLEASPAGQPLYAKWGWERLEGTETAMLRRGSRKT
ncbi:hypothetical protein JCM1841_003716 [Sporobolomyces salmonicolor]